MNLRARAVLAAVAVVTVATLLAPPAMAVFGADDELPGVPVPASPVNGTLDATVSGLDYDDVYAVRLGFNDRLDVSLSGAPGTDFDLWLWKPGSPNLGVSNPLTYVVASSMNENVSTEQFWYVASAEGTHSIDVWSYGDTAGAYQLQWSVVTLPTPQIAYTVPSSVKWGGAASITGTATVGGIGLDRPRIMIAARPKGTTTWSYLNKDRDPSSATYTLPKTVGSPQGAFSYTVYPNRLMEYRAIVWPTHDVGRVYGPVKLVIPRASLTTPNAPKTVYKKRTFTTAGYLKPKHKKGAHDVKLRFYRLESGTWKWRKTVRTTNYTSKKYPTWTRYSRSTYLPYRGKWRIIAYVPGDSTHSQQYSAPRYLTVK